MPSYSDMSEFELRQALLDLERDLTENTPKFNEMRMVERLLAGRKPGSKPIYADIPKLIDSISLCLRNKGRAMTLDEILEDLVLGGCKGLTLAAGRTLVRNSMAYHVSKARMIRKGDLYGLAGWGKEKFIAPNQ